MADQSPDAGWWTLAAALVSGVALREFWRPLGAWVGRRLDLATARGGNELTSCREEIKRLEERLDGAGAQMMTLASEVSMLRERVRNLEEDKAEWLREKRRLTNEIDRLKRQGGAGPPRGVPE